MAIAQMNWGQMLYPLTDFRMREFAAHLDALYDLAESAPGFIWRIEEDQLKFELAQLKFDELTSATVSVWRTLEDLRKYTFDTAHGQFLSRSREWFAPVSGPQLVIWPVEAKAKPSFIEANRRLQYLKKHGPSEYACGWG